MDCVNLIVSISAIFIALCSLGVSIWQGHETRNNYRLSCKPKLVIDGFWTEDSDPPGIVLFNKGLGPALITSFEIYLNSKIIKIGSVETNMYFAISKSLQNSGFEEFNYDSINKDDAITVGERRPLIWLRNNDRNIEKVLTFKEKISGVLIKIEYESFYGKKFIVNYPDHSEFDSQETSQKEKKKAT